MTFAEQLLVNLAMARDRRKAARVDWGCPDDGGTTFNVQPDETVAQQLARHSCQCGGNIDALLIAAIRHAKAHGHESVFLRQLGVPLQRADAAAQNPTGGRRAQLEAKP